MGDLIRFLGACLLVGGLVLGPILTCADSYGRYQCNNYQEISGKPTKWALLDMCYVKTKKGWQRWDEYKARSTASEGLRSRN